MAITESPTTSPTTDIQPELLPTDADRDTAVAFAHATGMGVNGFTSHADLIAQVVAYTRLTSTTPTLGDMIARESFANAVWDALKADTSDLRKQQRIVRALDALSAAPASPIPTSVANEGDRIREVTAEMRRFMPNACGDWADKIDAALASREGRKVAFYNEPGQDIRPGESLPDRDRRIYEQGRHDALNDEPEAFI